MRGRRRAPRPQIPWRSPWTPVVCVTGLAAAATLFAVTHLSKDVRLVVDGETVAVRSFAASVQDLLVDAGISVGFGDYLSLSVRDSLADGGTIEVRHARPIRLTIDGRTTRRMVTSSNVADALAELEIDQAGGRVSAPPTGTVPLSGMSITMFTERRVYVIAGRHRRWTVTTAGTVRDVLRQERIPAPRGYKITPAPESFPRQGTVIRVEPPGPVLPPHTVAIRPDVAGLNWAGLAQCESGGNPRALNPGGPYYGMYQFNLASWQAVGGAGTPVMWPAEEQTYRAQMLYQRVSGRWQGQWPHCGARLFGRS
ncbi:ubiquitin-like domain-containing protein [Nonomuraea sp. NBC_01738]|uniref:resuscitation-promoting factor n=1 Tax=Nonomuraea sp. NBC_01738 TaxID=2976003 RepID=UPI002E0D1FC5|nr:ubiquitin-like domain-containing protein [Nonomuraea sp. NBC_01738]